MSGTFDVDVQQIQQVAKDWTTETEAMGKMPAQLSSIEGHLSSLLEHSFLQDIFNPAAEVIQAGIWFALRDSLKKAAGELNTLVQQLQDDSQLLNRCSIEYQIADDAAANNITDIQGALSSNAPGSSQIRALLNQLGGSDQGTAEGAAQALVGTPAGGGSTTTAGTGTGGGTSTGGGGSTSSGGSGGGSGTGSGGGTVTSGGGGGSSTGSGGGGSGTGGGVSSTTGGAWSTTGNWTAGIHGPRTGQGMQTKLPDYSKLSSTRQQIMSNMVARIDHKVGYSQSADTDGYRDDCSGSVSAAWGLKKPGTNCTGLMSSSVSHQISKNDLQPGDALIAADHVVLFGGWANSAHTEYYALEDNGSQGSVGHVIPYPYYWENGKTPGGTYEPYRKNGVS
ncbi:hypothetical protein [Actinospica robiniae]|uniref:hypothetical protein n=1 Tax=Actinospica robiniae TaxID=304901 RepID=UPI00040F984F|nr:hypothetical protein [Actinospica robiniae]